MGLAHNELKTVVLNVQKTGLKFLLLVRICYCPPIQGKSNEMSSFSGEINDMWVELEDIETGRALMSLSWLEATPDRKILAQRQAAAAKKEDAAANLAKCLLHVYVDSCKDISPLKGRWERVF